MKLTIVMLALESREWKPLAIELLRQAVAFDDVEFLVELDAGQKTSGLKRQIATDRSHGEYICFVDDDDWVAPDYVAELRTGCLSGADVVTFNLHVTHPDRVDEYWRFGLYADRRSSGLMTVNHLCAWKKSIATRVAWCLDVGFADDQLWYKPLFHADALKTEHHIDRTLYQYHYNPTTSAFQRDRKTFSRNYVGDGLRCFFGNDDEILIEVGNREQSPDTVCVRDRNNVESVVPLDSLRHYYTATIV